MLTTCWEVPFGTSPLIYQHRFHTPLTSCPHFGDLETYTAHTVRLVTNTINMPINAISLN